MKESTRVLTALGAAVACGAAISTSASAPLLRAADWIAPVGTIWVNAIRMTVIPLVVSLIVTGVASTSSLSSIGRMGGRTLLVFGSLVVGCATIVIPFASAIFTLLPRATSVPALPAGAAEAARQVAANGQSAGLGEWIQTLIPSNPVAAAANGALVPLIVFTILFALAVAQSPAAGRDTLVRFFQALGDAMFVLVRWIIALAPVGIFALVLPLAARAGGSLVGGIGFYIVAYAGACMAMTLLLYPVVAMAGGVPVRRFAKAAMPAQLIALSSSSSVASLPALVESAELGLGLSNRVTGFVLPLSVSVFKVAAPVSWTVGALFVGWFYGIPLHARELATIAFAAVFLGFAGPGIPRGAFIMLTPLLVAIGLPPEGVGILIAVDAIPDVFSTLLNVTGDLAAVAIVAKTEA
jgi:Na+/H+-dicarboxylate symporter